MSGSTDIKEISYNCIKCNQTRKLKIDSSVHLQRRELEVNGLASYIDIHTDKESKNPHGIKLFIDKNFHVRTNNVLKVSKPKTTSPSPSKVPMPGFKTKNLTTKFNWESWQNLELELKTDGLKFVLEMQKEEDDNKIIKPIEITSQLGSVTCSLDAILEETNLEIEEYITDWIMSLCNSLELASSIHKDLIPEVLRYIDHHAYRPITYSDKTIISILIDKASILIPDKDTMEMISKYGPAVDLIGLDQDDLTDIIEKLSDYDQFSMIDIQNILEEEVDQESALEEEFIVLALFYLISLDAFDYKLSYLNRPEETTNDVKE